MRIGDKRQRPGACRCARRPVSGRLRHVFRRWGIPRGRADRRGASGQGREVAAARGRSGKRPGRRKGTPGIPAFGRQRGAGRPPEQPGTAGDLCRAGDRGSGSRTSRPHDEPALRVSPDEQGGRAKAGMGPDVPDHRWYRHPEGTNAYEWKGDDK